MDRIIVGAMARSGSTWTFNAVRLLAAQVYGPTRVNAIDIGSYSEDPETDIEVIKVTEPLDNWGPATEVVTCIRDIRDAFCSAVAAQLMEVESYNRRGLCEGVFTGMDLLLVDPSHYWHEKANMIIHFEQMMINKVGTLGNLAHKLFPCHRFAPNKLEEIAVALEILPEIYEEYDPEQGYIYGAHRHRQHVGIGGYRSRLSYADVQYIESKYQDWFKTFGYQTGESAMEVGNRLYE